MSRVHGAAMGDLLSGALHPGASEALADGATLAAIRAFVDGEAPPWLAS
jgi:hypothetical protein